MITTLKPGRNVNERQQAERNVRSKVEEIIEKVRQHGDTAIRELSVAFDRWDRESYRLSQSEIDQLLKEIIWLKRRFHRVESAIQPLVDDLRK